MAENKWTPEQPLWQSAVDIPAERMTVESVKRGMEAIANWKPRDPTVLLSRRQYKIAQQLIAEGRDPLSAALEAQCR